MRQVVLCADDFGLTEGVSRGILDLAHMGRLSATSAMTNRPWWPRLGPELDAKDGRLGIGLHLTLTLGEPLGSMRRLAPDGVFPGLSEVLRGAFLQQLPLNEIAAEIDRQLIAFEVVRGGPPDFVDGHQHVHVLPGIRGRLLRVLQERGWGGRVWLRDPSDGLGAIARRRVAIGKALTVRALATGFGRAARETGFGVNEGFSGFSDFAPDAEAAPVFEAAFEALGAHPLVMCHPGVIDDELRTTDPIAEARSAELAYLSSPRFADLLETRRVRLVPAPGA